MTAPDGPYQMKPPGLSMARRSENTTTFLDRGGHRICTLEVRGTQDQGADLGHAVRNDVDQLFGRAARRPGTVRPDLGRRNAATCASGSEHGQR
jgi:hypothetical protein